LLYYLPHILFNIHKLTRTETINNEMITKLYSIVRISNKFSTSIFLKTKPHAKNFTSHLFFYLFLHKQSFSFQLCHKLHSTLNISEFYE